MRNLKDKIRIYSDLYLYIVVIGVGGTGSELIRQLSQVVAASNIPHTLMLVDKDFIEPKNLKNQSFLRSEVGEMKAEVLAERYGQAYPNLNIFSYTENYIENLDELTKLLNPLYLDTTNFNSDQRFIPIIVGCVDNNYSRKVFHAAYKALNNCIYIDAGNESAVVPPDWQTRPFNMWSNEEQQTYQESGWSGQVVCGVRLNGDELQPALAGLYPEVLTDTDSVKAPSELSCSELAASDPQRSLVNKYSAMSLMTYLYEIIEERTISNHHTMFHAKKGYMKTEQFDKEKFEEMQQLLSSLQ